METVSGYRIGSATAEQWLVVGNEYIDPDMTEQLEVVTGLPVIELKSIVALQSRIDDIKQDIELSKNIICMKEAKDALIILERMINKI